MRQVNLVNSADEIIGQTDLLDAHRGSGKKHQAISLFLFHQEKSGNFKLLLQQRSQNKIVGALQWANTLCANLAPEENHLNCLKRRVFEELGFKWQANWFLKKIAVLDYQVACENGFSENEVDHFFVAVLNDSEVAQLKISSNPQEVLNTVWLDWTSVKNKTVGERTLTPWFNLFLNHQEIIKQIDETLQIWQKQN